MTFEVSVSHTSFLHIIQKGTFDFPIMRNNGKEKKRMQRVGLSSYGSYNSP